MRKKYLAIIALIIIIGIAGCKPTEKNYKAAYDAAVQKRQAAASDPDMNLPAGTLLQTDGPQLRVINGDSVYVLGERLKFIDGVEHEKHKYSVAVAAYKMQTNCAAQVSDLFTKGYQAFGAQNPDGTFYVIAGSFKTLDEAASFCKSFATKEKKHIYSGLPSAPVILIE